tara:strand:- start:584 stop:775 length:192 start_codon:yes stop_codon:yes gene_type:complete
MAIGDLVYDRSVCRYGIILEKQMWTLIGVEEPEWEYTILYGNGDIDTAYGYELWNENEIQNEK